MILKFPPSDYIDRTVMRSSLERFNFNSLIYIKFLKKTYRVNCMCGTISYDFVDFLIKLQIREGISENNFVRFNFVDKLVLFSDRFRST